MIQIDIPMPSACDVCPFNYDFCWCRAFEYDDNWEKYSDDWNENVCERTTRPEYCPLKEQEAKEQISDAIHETAKQFRQTIVRCKDCKHGRRMKTEDGIEVYCENNRIERIFCEQDWFCADGERREDDA